MFNSGSSYTFELELGDDHAFKGLVGLGHSL